MDDWALSFHLMAADSTSHTRSRSSYSKQDVQSGLLLNPEDDIVSDVPQTGSDSEDNSKEKTVSTIPKWTLPTMTAPKIKAQLPRVISKAKND